MPKSRLAPTNSITEMWDKRYGSDLAVYGLEPNTFLAAMAGMLPKSGRALLPGDGQGRNGIWLAQQGLHPLSIDMSSVAIAQTEEAAARQGVRLDTQIGNFLEIDLEEGAFSCVAPIFFHVPSAVRQSAHGRMAKALAPGGLLILEAFAIGHLPLRDTHGSGGPGTNDMLYSADILRQDFGALQCLYLEELEIVLREGSLHDGLSRTVRAVFAK
ncbi:MAG: class I SAM-dependent methyltransferase [Pseudomonadota bacterium]